MVKERVLGAAGGDSELLFTGHSAQEKRDDVGRMKVLLANSNCGSWERYKEGRSSVSESSTIVKSLEQSRVTKERRKPRLLRRSFVSKIDRGLRCGCCKISGMMQDLKAEIGAPKGVRGLIWELCGFADSDEFMCSVFWA